MRALFKKAPVKKERLDINEVVEEVLLLTRIELQRNRVSPHVELANDLPLILGDRIELQQVMLNLLINAIEAMSGVGEGPCFNSRCRFALMAEVGSDRSVLKTG